ncbi:MAG: hypothetical protein PHH60_00020 [Candidatus Margulisbacteria bacterium]|nr:hypothetical protein [Candidatus Margulisiibacteriota bacterium]
MDVLRDKFDEVTAQLQPVPGFQDVYSLRSSGLSPVEGASASDKTSFSAIV